MSEQIPGESYPASLALRFLTASLGNITQDWTQPKEFSYIQSCGLTQQDVGELLALARLWCDEAKLDDFVAAIGGDERASYIPIHAWRALGELRAVEATRPLFEMYEQLSTQEEDYFEADFPVLLSLFGTTVIPIAIEYARNDSCNCKTRIVAVNTLYEIANQELDSKPRSEIVKLIADLFQQVFDCKPANVDENTDEVRLLTNALGLALKLKAAEVAPLIEKAFAENLIDIDFTGDWEAARHELGVDGIGLPMPRYPIRSLRTLRYLAGMGIFSETALITPFSDSINDDAVSNYLARIVSTFQSSPEGQEVIRTQGRIEWTRIYFEFAFRLKLRIVDNMTLDDAQSILLDEFPRRISVTPDWAASIVAELRQFWTFIARSFAVPNAEIIRDSFDAETERHLRQQLAVPNSQSSSELLTSDFYDYFDESLDDDVDQPPKVHVPSYRTAAEKKAFNKKRYKLLKRRK